MPYKDNRIHVEKTVTPDFGHTEIRDFVAHHTGLVGDLPKMVTTGCGKRRNWARISKNPDSVNCKECREWAFNQYRVAADMADSLLEFADPELYEKANTTPSQVRAERDRAREMADKYAN